MTRTFRLASAAMLTLFGITPALAGPACLSRTEAQAMQVRQLHIQLQVASLNCRADDPSLPGKYASYVSRFDKQLGENARVLRGHFARQPGKDPTKQLDRYMTILANDESERAHLVEHYCESHVPLFQNLLSIKPHELESFAARTMAAPGQPVCADSKTQEVKADSKANVAKNEQKKKQQPKNPS